MDIQTNVLSLGEKIKQIRIAKELSQESLAYAAQCNVSTISRIETGQLECTPKILAAIRKFMEIENAPLLDHEIARYRQDLNLVGSLLGADRNAEAKALASKLASIIHLPFEQELYLEFYVRETSILTKDPNFPTAEAEERLNTAEALLDSANNETLYLFHHNKATFHLMHMGEPKNALKHILIALDLKEPTARILGNIGVLYNVLDKPL